MRRLVPVLAVCFLLAEFAHAQTSTITVADGYACMGYDKSRKQTEEEALTHARRNAVEFAAVHIRSRAEYRDSLLQQDLLQAYAQGTAKILEVFGSEWVQDPRAGECYRLQVKAEVVPEEASFGKVAASPAATGGPGAPLQVEVWTGQREYRQGEHLAVHLRANKDCYASVVYRDAGGQAVQLLPNPYRSANRFGGGVTYDLPAGEDRFDLKVGPPFGDERVTVYASTVPLGELDLQAEGGVYRVTTGTDAIGSRTRGIQIVPGGTQTAAEFAEATTELVTRP